MRNRKNGKVLVLAGLMSLSVLSGTGNLFAASDPGLPELQEQSEEQDQTIEQEQNEKQEQRGDEETENTAVEAYILEHLNNEYVPEGAELKAANALQVKQTFFDGKYVKAEDSIDSIMDTLEDNMTAADMESRKYLAQIGTNVLAYDAGESNDYYIALVDTMKDDSDSTVQDVSFALWDNEGQVLDNCIYDEASGIAYIPKSDFLDADGKEQFMNVQVQLMQVLTSLQATDQANLELTIDGESTLEQVESDVFDLETEILVGKGLVSDSIRVEVNGIERDPGEFSYQSKTGMLTLDESIAGISDIHVEAEEKGVLAKAYELLFSPEEVQAISADAMKMCATDIELPGWVKDGTLLSGTAGYAYTDGSLPWMGSYGYNPSSENDLKEIYNLVENGGKLAMDRIQSQASSKYLTGHLYFALGETELSSGGNSFDDAKKLGHLILECAHISSAASTVHNPAASHVVLENVKLRFLSVNRDAGYAIFAVHTLKCYNQVGTGIFKIGIQKSGSGYVAKKDSQTEKVLDGAVYGIYKDEACTIPAYDIEYHGTAITTISKAPYSNMMKLTPGTYYVKELYAPEGYVMDEKVKILQIQDGTYAYAREVNGSSNYLMDIPYGAVTVLKRDSLTDQVISGAEYQIFEDPACTIPLYGLTDQGAESNQIFTRSESPYVDSYLSYPAGTTAYVREVNCPKGYYLDETIYPITIHADNQTKLVTVGSYEIPYQRIQVIKYDEKNPKKLLEGAVYKVYTDQSCSQTAKSVTGEEVVFTSTKAGSNEVAMMPGTYYMKEDQPVKGSTVDQEYEISDEVIDFTVANGNDGIVRLGVKYIKMYDEPTGTELEEEPPQMPATGGRGFFLLIFLGMGMIGLVFIGFFRTNKVR